MPMLAANGPVPLGSGWAFEFDWDGLRALFHLAPGDTRIRSASGRSITSGYPELAPLSRLAQRCGPLVLDGKIVTADRLGSPSMVPLRRRMNNPKPSEALIHRVPVRAYLSDVLYANGRDTMAMPFRERRKLLAQLDLAGLPAQLSPCFIDADGPTVLNVAQRHGLAGVLAKRLDSRYQPGHRTSAWVRITPRYVLSVLVGGWLPRLDVATSWPEALLVGVADSAGSLRYLAKVNTGLDAAARADLAAPLARLAADECPFTNPPDEGLTGARWLTPQLVGEVSYRRWDADGLPRHVGWLGIRAGVHPASVRGPLAPEESRPGQLDELAADAVRLAQAELRTLRAQISPHFVYNALTTIAVYVRTDPDRARELLHVFAEYARYSFRAGAPASTLGAELANVDRYLAIEGARFGERLRVRREIDPELHDVELPMLAVQSLVENAVRHGIEGTESGGTVHIRAERVDLAHCLITIADDGIGMDPDVLTEAITDVRERLAVGSWGVLKVVTAPEAGTTITVRLPTSAGTLGG